MMRLAIVTFPMLLCTTPLLAQAVPNYPVENASQREVLVTQQNEFTQAQARQVELQRANDRLRADSVRRALLEKRPGAAQGTAGLERARMLDPVYRAAALDVPLLAVTSRGIGVTHLEPASTAPLFITRETPLRLSLVSPDAAESEGIRVAVILLDANGLSIASFAGGMITDAGGATHFDLPAVSSGEYLLRASTTSLGRTVETRHAVEQRLIAPAH